ncbi:hypothetical protein PIB30_053249 [Stylosanthes scabra]|uniref:Transposase MuDR plant domain-containing protein n=1 Tax=Stylosanthes scabra TaxID=79078 RepID=A0ABU6YFW0_9FABA|nr:hypothetical protein [Stylosanthes scabra]
MRLPKQTPIIRMAYRFLAVLPNRSCRYRVFWLSNDEHVRSMFASHGRILTDKVIRLYVQILDTLTTMDGAGSSDSGPAVYSPMTTNPVDMEFPRNIPESLSLATRIRVTLRRAVPDELVLATPVGTQFLLPAPFPVPDISNLDSHFHTLDLDAINEEKLTDIWDEGYDYDLDGGVEFRVRHRFCSREAVHIGVKNYSIKGAAKYKVLEFDSMKYHCVCKQSANGCCGGSESPTEGEKVRWATCVPCTTDVH